MPSLNFPTGRLLAQRCAPMALCLAVLLALMPPGYAQPQPTPAKPDNAAPKATPAAPPAAAPAPRAPTPPAPPAAAPAAPSAAPATTAATPAGQPSTPAPSAPPYLTQFLVPGSHFHGVHGLAFDRDDQLYAGSVVGQEIYKVDAYSGEVEVNVPAPKGMADDIAFGPDGVMAWTSYLTGQIFARTKPGEPIRELANNLPGINSLAFTKDGKLFASQVFLGDALWEIDTSPLKPDPAKNEIPPPKPARKVLENLGGLNGFEFGPDGLLYGPLWFKGMVVKIDVDKKTVTPVATGFKIPAAVNFASSGELYVVDTALGQVVQVDVASGQKTLVATVKPSIDNLAIDSRNRIFITNMADNGIYLIDKETGQARTIVEGKLSVPGDIALFSDGKSETLYVADLFAYRSVDTATGEVKTLLRMQADQLEYPFNVSVNAKHVLLSSWFTNSVEVIDRVTGKPLDMLHDFKTPSDVLELDDGTILVLEMTTGSLLKVKGPGGKDRTVVASDLKGPVAMASAGAGAVYVSEIGTGSILRIALANGAKTVVVRDLKGPEGLDVAPDGRIIAAEVGLRRVVAIDPKTGAITPLAVNLAIGLEGNKVGVPQYVPTGVAVSKSGAIYVSSDRKNAIYKLTPP
jgi:sugar lactone lactonase YvrE